jgi:uncharacterized repeat protein (TIGR02543 family)
MKIFIPPSKACLKHPLVKHVICLGTILICFVNLAYGQWSKKADELSKRAECNNVVYKNKIYMFGGFGDNPIIEKTNEVYDIAVNKWSRIASFPVGKEITHQGIVLVDDNVWLIGGRAVDAHGPASSQVIIYNITTNTWVDGPELINPATGKAFPLGGGGYALLGRTIHVFGGFGPTMCEDQSTLHLTINVDKYMANKNSVTWENKLAPMPIPRNHLSYVVLAGKIYALGGQFKHDCGAVDQVYCHVYDRETNKWTRLTDLPVPRSHAEASTFAIDGKIFFVAGQGRNDFPQNTTYQFDPKLNNNLGSWANVTSYKLPGSFLGLSARLVGNSFIIANGALNVYNDERKETYIANIARSGNRTLGFTTACITDTVTTGTLTTIKNLLYCVEDAASYTITSNAAWLKITNNGGGITGLNGVDIEASINTAGMDAGDYTGKVTATSISTGTTTSFCVNLSINGSSIGETLKIISAGSGTVTQTPYKSRYAVGDRVSLNAIPANGWAFKGWTGDTIATSNPLDFVIDTSKTITATFEQAEPTGILITNVAAATGKIYPLAEMFTGLKYYTDRAYTIKTVPTILKGLTTICTANDDKANKSASMLSFNLSENATVYVAYDPRGTKLPDWLNGWTKLNEKLGVNELQISSFNLYSKVFNAGKVTLGGNLASPGVGAMCQYIVMAKPNNSMALKASTANKNDLYQASTLVKSDSTKNKIETATNKTFLYPNPAIDKFTLVFPSTYTGIAQIHIVDFYGKKHIVNNANITFADTKFSFQISQLVLRPGLYSVITTSKEGKKNLFRLIIK